VDQNWTDVAGNAPTQDYTSDTYFVDL